MVDTDGSIVLYDNGNFRPGTVLADGDAAPYSRAVRIEVDDESDDPAEWSARQVWDHVLEDPKTGTPAFAPFVSDADALPNGNVSSRMVGSVASRRSSTYTFSNTRRRANATVTLSGNFNSANPETRSLSIELNGGNHFTSGHSGNRRERRPWRRTPRPQASL
jgi:hypothetical protein